MAKMKVAVFLPAKGTSSRVENKNTKLLDGKPLFLHTLDTLKKCRRVDEIYLDSEADKIFNLASEYPHKPLRRAADLATNKADGNALFANEIAQVRADIYVQILCTSPFIMPETIDRAIEILIDKSQQFDSVVLVRKEKLYTWEMAKGRGVPSYNIDKIPNSETLSDTVIETMGLYAMKAEAAHRLKRRIGERPYFLEASPREALDVNYPEEFALANFVMAGMREASNVQFRNLAQLLTSAMLADITDDLGLNAFIGGYHLNFENKKILGRAKTLKLRKLNDGENFKGIYDALHSYDTVVPGDIIAVESETPDYAYFGSLNANLAIRHGALGAIIGGNTRDYIEVKNLDFPVFSKGYAARDVRKRATVGDINKTIVLDGVKISPGDVIFADYDGIIVIPAHLEKTVIARALEVVKKENKIIQDIALAIKGNELAKKHGDF